MSNFEETCPSCNNTKDNYFMGSGANFTLYYSCINCGHSFIVDGSIYAQEDGTQEEEFLSDTELFAGRESY